MNDKDMSNAVAKLTEATARLEDSTSNLNKTINTMIGYCTILTLLMFATFVIAIIF